MRFSISAFALGLLLVTTAECRRQKPLKTAGYPGYPYPVCDKCVPREVVKAPGIGFDLTTSYGTSAIRYYNGSVVDLARVDGSEDYKKMMRKLAGPYKQHGPPFDNAWERMKYELDQAKRRYRKIRGLPSTEDIETLSNFLSLMKWAVTQTTYMHVTNVVITFPHLPNLLLEDYSEALDFSGLTELKSYKHYGLLREVNAAWAGMGFGLCEHWEDIEKCELEEEKFSEKMVLTVSFTQEELITDFSIVVNAHQAWSYSSKTYFDLGYGAWESNQSNATFWDTLGAKVREMAELTGMEVDDLLLMGEHAGDKKFLDAVWKALGDVPDLDVPSLWKPLQTSKFNATFMAARGAAELAKRWEGETWDCVEGEWCKGNEVTRADL